MNAQAKPFEDLQAVIADAYRTFGHYRKPTGHLDACTYCCMSAELEQEMRGLPLAQLTGEHFYAYNTAAWGDPVQPADELKYLLPRMLALMAEGVDVHHSVELSLDRVGRCASGSFSSAEAASLDRFALAYFRCALSGNPKGDRSGRLPQEPLSLLLMFHIGGVAIEPLLDAWLETEEPEATVQFVDETYWRYWKDNDYSNAFADNHPAFRAQLQRWLADPETRQCFVRKLMAPEFQCLAQDQCSLGGTTFSTRVDAAFDQLTQ
jgi:hypothetical protein